MSGPRRNNRKINRWYFAEKERYISKTLGIEGNHFLSLLFILPGNHNHRSVSPSFQRSSYRVIMNQLYMVK